MNIVFVAAAGAVSRYSKTVGFALGGMHDHEAAAADVAGGRMRDGEREGGGDGGVDGVAALLEDRQARLGAWLGDSDDDAAAKLGRLFAGVDIRKYREDRDEQKVGTKTY